MNHDEVCAVVDGIEVYASVFREGDATWYKDEYGWDFDIDRHPVFVGFYYYDDEGFPVGATEQQVVKAEAIMLKEYWDLYSYEGIL